MSRMEEDSGGPANTTHSCSSELVLHGGWGFMWETEIAKSYASARVQTIYGGTNEVMKELIARNIVKK